MNFTLRFDNAGVSSSERDELFGVLKSEIGRIKESLGQKGYTTSYASLNLPFDELYFDTIQKCVADKKSLNPSLIVVVGIGGSNLGTIAFQEALFGKLYNEKNPAIKIYYADTVDSNYISDILHCVTNELKSGKKIIINVVTKSGATTETIANFELFLDLLMHYHPSDFSDYIVVTTDRDSVLWKISQESNFALLEIPKNVGGRYSVFSAVGLFPLGLLGCDVTALMRGAQDILKHCSSLSLDENYAAQTACVIFAQYKKNIIIQDMFLFSVQLEGIGKWYRQLMGESIGKEFDCKGQKVETGITPTVSMGTVDLHSVGQLYLGGPRDKGTTFVSVKKNQHRILPFFEQFEQAVGKIQGKPMTVLMDAILRGVKTAYVKNKRPFLSIELPRCSEYYLGQLLQYKMVEMIYLGYLLGVNPFDQPNVESYKQETRKILLSCMN